MTGLLYPQFPEEETEAWKMHRWQGCESWAHPRQALVDGDSPVLMALHGLGSWPLLQPVLPHG